MSSWINKNYSHLFATKQPFFGQEVESKPVPAPIGGWDAISPISNMEPKYAVILDNWVPRPGWIEFRGGYNAWAQAISTEPVETVMTYRPQGAAQRLFAATGPEIWETSLYGLPSLALSGLGSAKWQYINFTPGGSTNTYLYLVNGTDAAKYFQGTTWTNAAITGVIPSNLININVHKRRIWFIENNTTNAWYLATDAIAGAAALFELGALLTKGGHILAMGTWTVDGGQGPDDLAVFISSQGQAIIYKGTDPGNANAWALVGVFDLPIPIGRRCFYRMGSDLLIMTTEGLLPISKALPFDPSSVRSVALTNRIQNAMLQAAQIGSDLFGWQVISFPKQSLLIMNVPQQQNTTQVQFVMNSLTGAWCRFTGWNANCFEIYNNSLYFGDNNGNVNLAYAGALDLVSPIASDMKCAFNYFDDPGRNKIMQMVRPLLVADGTLTPTIGVDFDFSDSIPTAPVTALTPSGGLWDSGVWDASLWSSGAAPVTNWLTVGAIGVALAVRMVVNLAGGGGAGTTVAQNSVFDTGTFDVMVFDGNGAITQSGVGVPTLQVNAFEAIMEFGGAI